MGFNSGFKGLIYAAFCGFPLIFSLTVRWFWD